MLPSTVCCSFRLGSRIRPAGTTRSVGIREVTPYVSSSGNHGGEGDRGVSEEGKCFGGHFDAHRWATPYALIIPSSSFRSFTSLSCSAVFEEGKTKTLKFFESPSLSFPPFFSVHSSSLLPSARTSHETPFPSFLYFTRLLGLTKVKT